MLFFALFFVTLSFGLCASSTTQQPQYIIYHPVDPTTLTSLQVLLLMGEQLKPQPVDLERRPFANCPPGFLLERYFASQDQRPGDSMRTSETSTALPQRHQKSASRPPSKRRDKISISEIFVCDRCGITYRALSALKRHQNGARHMIPCIANSE